MLKIGNIPLGRGPVIVLTVTDSESLRLIKKARRYGARLIEVRIDRFRKVTDESILARIRSLRKCGMPLIATLRSRKEGGAKSLSEKKRLELYRKILPLVHAMDVELSSKSIVTSLVRLAHGQRKKVILSYHNFHYTPPDSALLKLIQTGKKKGADLVKIAVTPKEKKDVARLLLLTHRMKDKNLISIAMGRNGLPSRTLAPVFGSLLTYSFLGRSQAPGQLPIRRLFEEMKPFFGNDLRR